MKYLTKVLSACLVMAAISTSPATLATSVKSYHQEVMLDKNGKADCGMCHEQGFQTPSEETCISCHGSKSELAELTASNSQDHSVEPNPHDSLHYGTDLTCTYCHSEHKESVIYCNYCHEFEYPNMKR